MEMVRMEIGADGNTHSDNDKILMVEIRR